MIITKRFGPLVPALLVAATSTLAAQDGSSRPLEFLGFRPGAPREEVQARLATHIGGWRCEASRVDPRIEECQGTLLSGRDTLVVTGSLVSGAAAVLLIAGPIDDAKLRQWLDDLTVRYGRVEPRSDHGQESWQWVRQSRMIRLTTRVEDRARVTSVSLVDGPLLDGLGESPLPPSRIGS